MDREWYWLLFVVGAALIGALFFANQFGLIRLPI